MNLFKLFICSCSFFLKSDSYLQKDISRNLLRKCDAFSIWKHVMISYLSIFPICALEWQKIIWSSVYGNREWVFKSCLSYRAKNKVQILEGKIYIYWLRGSWGLPEGCVLLWLGGKSRIFDVWVLKIGESPSDQSKSSELQPAGSRFFNKEQNKTRRKRR